MTKEQTHLKSLYESRDLLKTQIQSATHKYIESLDGDRGIYISDHAIVRYLERVKDIVFPDDSMSDKEKLEQYSKLTGMYIGYIREQMLTLEEDRDILSRQASYYRRENYSYIITSLTVITVLTH